MSDYQGRQVDEQPRGHTPSITNRSRKARGDCKRSINVISLRVMKQGNYNMQTCKKTEGNKLLLLLLLLLISVGEHCRKAIYFMGIEFGNHLLPNCPIL